ncbi:MAG: hypothetical protein ABUR63_00320 [Verrucomicrobiota bacterium]
MNTHPKFAKLVARLRTTPAARAIARGALELLWEAGYAEGDPRLGDAESVEAVAEWTGPTGELAGHLVATGFLDRDERGVHSIHDLADHAPDYVARRMARAAERAAAGTTISEIRSRARLQGTNDNKRISFVTSVDPPAPAPAPAPAQNSGGVPPAPARDPGATDGVAPAPHGYIDLAALFGRSRYAALNVGSPYQTVPMKAETIGEVATLAAQIKASGDMASVVPTMELFWDRVKSGDLEKRYADESALAFGKWRSLWPNLLEAVRGEVPTLPAVARGSPRGQPSTATRDAAARVLAKHGELP